MNKLKIIKTAIILLGLFGVGINLLYTTLHIQTFLSMYTTTEHAEIFISAISGSIGFVLILFWMILKPLERKEILLIITIPMIIANLLHSDIYLQNHPDDLSQVMKNILFGVLYSGLHIFVYLLAKQNEQTQTT